MELYKKHRPTTLQDVIGQEQAVTLLNNYLKNQNLPHAIIFTGESGVGKTTIARILSKKLNCHEVKELNCSDVRGIDTIREISEQVQFAPLVGDSLVYILDEAHKITNDAQSALLKLLEDPPNYVYFFICTTEPAKLIKTIHTRCTKVELFPLQSDDIKLLINKVLNEENEILSDDIIFLLKEKANGSARMALVLLEGILQLQKEEQETYLKTLEGLEAKAIDLCRALMNLEPWENITKILVDLKEEDPEGIRRMILAYFNTVLLKTKGKRAEKASKIMECFTQSFFYTGKPGLTLACYKVCGE